MSGLLLQERQDPGHLLPGLPRTLPGQPHLFLEVSLPAWGRQVRCQTRDVASSGTTKAALRVLGSQMCGSLQGPGDLPVPGAPRGHVPPAAPFPRSHQLSSVCPAGTLYLRPTPSRLHLSECHSNLKKVYVHFLPHLRCPSAYRSRQIKINFAFKKKPCCIFLTLNVCSFAWDTFFHNESS